MKKFLILSLFSFLSSCGATVALCQTVKHHDYITYYNAKIGEPDSVSWVLTPSMINCATHLARSNKFIADSSIPNTEFNIYYNGSSYDQGHQFPAQDASCNSTDEIECFYFTNMAPQRPALNRVTWKNLEVYTRGLARTQTVYVTCGVMGSLGYLVGIERRIDKKTHEVVVIKHPSSINIPAYCWKRLKYNGNVEYYIMPNVDSVKSHPFTYYRTK